MSDRLRHWLGGIVALNGAACGLLAAAGFVRASDGGDTIGWLLLHGLAAASVALAAGLRARTRTEAQLHATMAAALPGVGALLAACDCLFGDGAGGTNAHAAHDPARHEAAVPRPTLERELRVTSHSRVLREGSLEQRRNLLRRLASLGEPRYLAIVRSFLADDEPELRLCAYAELAAVAARNEARIAQLRETDAVVELAAAQHAHARCGALDEEMARYWLAQAEATARRAVAADAASLPAQRVLAAVLGSSGRVDEAWAIAAGWPSPADAASELVRADLAFRRRDREACARAQTALAATGEPVPAWLQGALSEEVPA